MAGKELIASVPFQSAETNLKYFGINLIKDMEDLYEENYKALKIKYKKPLKDGEMYYVPG